MDESCEILSKNIQFVLAVNEKVHQSFKDKKWFFKRAVPELKKRVSGRQEKQLEKEKNPNLFCPWFRRNSHEVRGVCLDSYGREQRGKSRINCQFGSFGLN